MITRAQSLGQTLRDVLCRLRVVRMAAEVKPEGAEDFLLISHGDLADLEEQLSIALGETLEHQEGETTRWREVRHEPLR